METIKEQLRSDWDKKYDLMKEMYPEKENDRGLFESFVNFLWVAKCMNELLNNYYYIYYGKEKEHYKRVS